MVLHRYTSLVAKAVRSVECTYPLSCSHQPTRVEIVGSSKVRTIRSALASWIAHVSREGTLNTTICARTVNCAGCHTDLPLEVCALVALCITRVVVLIITDTQAIFCALWCVRGVGEKHGIDG